MTDTNAKTVALSERGKVIEVGAGVSFKVLTSVQVFCIHECSFSSLKELDTNMAPTWVYGMLP